METKRGRICRGAPILLLCAVSVLAAGCYAKMYDDPSIQKEDTAIIRGPMGPGFPMQMTIGEREKPKKTVRIPAGHYELQVKWIGETAAPPDFMEGHLLRVPYQCSMAYDFKAGKKYDVTVIKQKVSLYEYDTRRVTGARKDGRIVASCEGIYLGCCRAR